jgi:hypothetical protein
MSSYIPNGDYANGREPMQMECWVASACAKSAAQAGARELIRGSRLDDDAGNDVSGDVRVPNFLITAIKRTSVQNSLLRRSTEITSVVVPIFLIEVRMTVPYIDNGKNVAPTMCTRMIYFDNSNRWPHNALMTE